MQIWVDADACPGDHKEMLYRAARRRGVRVTLVANQVLSTPRSALIDTVLVPGGMNEADRKIVELVAPGDLVITADIPLAADIVAKGAQALNPRGELYTDANVGERLAIRNLVDDMRGGGRTMRGPSGFTARDRQAFANQLDRWLALAERQAAQRQAAATKAQAATQKSTAQNSIDSPAGGDGVAPPTGTTAESPTD